MTNEPYLADKEKLSSLKDMYCEFHRETSGSDEPISNESKRDIDRHLTSIRGSDNDWVYLVDGSGKTPVGFIACHKYNNAADKHIKPGDVEIESFVAREGRGQGLGKILKTTAIDSVAERADGSARVLSSVERGNSVNIHILKKTGFRELRGTAYSANNGQEYSVYAKKVA